MFTGCSNWGPVKATYSYVPSSPVYDEKISKNEADGLPKIMCVITGELTTVTTDIEKDLLICSQVPQFVNDGNWL